MRTLNSFAKLTLVAVLIFASASACALSISIASDPDNRTPVASGTTIDVQLTGASGTISVSNTNATSVTATKISSTSTKSIYRLKGVSTGIANITFKDSKGKATAYLKVLLRQGTLDGRQLASNCYQCHGTNGTGGFERLLGESYSEIYGELIELITEQEDEGEIMKAHAMGYTDAQMQALANYLAQLR